MTWKASNLCHKPLYFEEVNLERYGHTAGPVLQPLVSSAHFFGNIIVLPYKMGVHGPTECQYSLGYYRPGNCAPWDLVGANTGGDLFNGDEVKADIFNRLPEVPPSFALSIFGRCRVAPAFPEAVNQPLVVGQHPDFTSQVANRHRGGIDFGSSGFLPEGTGPVEGRPQPVG